MARARSFRQIADSSCLEKGIDHPSPSVTTASPGAGRRFSSKSPDLIVLACSSHASPMSLRAASRYAVGARTRRGSQAARLSERLSSSARVS